MRTYPARQVLEGINYDLTRQLKDGTDNKTIARMIKKRIDQLLNSKITKIIWEEEKNGENRRMGKKNTTPNDEENKL
jgi:hypothetical protein